MSQSPMSQSQGPIIPKRAEESGEIDYSDPVGDDFEALARDTIPVRSMIPADLDTIVAIDRRATGRDRTPYYERKLKEALEESGIRVSLVADRDDHPVGFIMARMDFGEYGETQPEAVIDTIGVDPAFAHTGVGAALISQLLANLNSLRVDRVRTEVDWNDFGLVEFLAHCGFAPSQRLAFRRRLGPPS